MYRLLTTKVPAVPAVTAVATGAAIGTNAGYLLCMGCDKIMEWFKERKRKATPEAVLAKYNGEQQKALWEALRANYGD